MSAYLGTESLNGGGEEAVEALRATNTNRGIRAFQRQLAEERFGKLNLEAGRRRVSPRAFAAVYAALGEKDQAFHWLEEAYRQRCPTLTWLQVDQQWDGVRSDPRFKDLLRRMKL